MKELDVKDCEFDNEESCYHLTRGVHEDSIAEKGLGADIGIRSKDGVGNEKTQKVFFAKSLEGTLIFLNRNLNKFRSVAKHNDFANIRSALKDDSPELYEQTFNDMVHDNMSEEELNEVALTLGELYLARGIYYKLDLKHCTREEFQNMDDQEQDEIDYLSDDINEERPDEQQTINNMHTRTDRGVEPSKLALMTTNGKKSALDIVVSMSEAYKALNPGKPLPVLEHKSGSKDRPLLEMMVTRLQEKSTQQLGQETLEEQKDTALLDEIEREQARQQRELINQKEGQENTQDK